MANDPFLRRLSITGILLTPLIVGLAGAWFLPQPAVVVLILLVSGAGVLFHFTLKAYGTGPVVETFKHAFGHEQGFAALFTNILTLIAITLLAWSTSFWGERASLWLYQTILSIPHNPSAVPEQAQVWAQRNIIVWPILVVLSYHVFQTVVRAMADRPGQDAPVGISDRLLICAVPVATALILALSNPVSGIFWSVIFASAAAELLVIKSLQRDIGGFVKRLLGGRRSWLGRIVLVLLILTVAAALGGHYATVATLTQIDHVAGTHLTGLEMVDMNLPVYCFAFLLILCSLLLFNSRISPREIRKARQMLGVVLSRRDGTVMYEAGKRSSVRDEVAEILQDAVEQRASDIHLEPSAEGLHIRYRVDGLLTKGTTYPQDVVKPVISSIKVMANMDIAERRRPQDGRFSGTINGEDIDFRVASTPMSFGEKVVVRVLNQSEGTLSLKEVGFRSRQLKDWLSVIKRPHGIVIVCGPTGSGKTTTIYATVREMDIDQLNVVTIEEPIEYKLHGVTQTAINEKANVTFATVLRSTLRQDPDVIFVGEIRDPDTAKIAMQASMTGHMVLTTVHATDVCSCLLRLMDLGVNDKNIISFSAILSQRLVRRLCPHCRREEPITDEEREMLSEVKVKEMPETLYHPVGCDECNGSGYRGRQAIFELLVIKDWIRELFLEDHTPGQIRKQLIKKGFTPMWHNGVVAALKGYTTLEEVDRVAVRD